MRDSNKDKISSSEVYNDNDLKVNIESRNSDSLIIPYWCVDFDIYQSIHDSSRELHRELSAKDYVVKEWEFLNYGIGGFFEKHRDNHQDKAIRLATMITMLDKSDDLEGGKLLLYINNAPTEVDLEVGETVMFDSWTVHEVTPITKGSRSVLVNWSQTPGM